MQLLLCDSQKLKELLGIVWEVSYHDGDGLEDGYPV